MRRNIFDIWYFTDIRRIQHYSIIIIVKKYIKYVKRFSLKYITACNNYKVLMKKFLYKYFCWHILRTKCKKFPILILIDFFYIIL